jgi:hypothetical protein
MPYANWLGMRCMMYGSLVAVMLMLHPCKPAKFGLFFVLFQVVLYSLRFKILAVIDFFLQF